MMSSSSLPFPLTVKHHRHRRPAPPRQNCSATAGSRSISFCFPSSIEINVRRSFPFFKRNSRFDRCCATSSPTEPPPPETPSEDKLPPSSGVTPKDTVQVFFAVLFWMSLFFWSCAWDRGNSGRPDKGSRFWNYQETNATGPSILLHISRGNEVVYKCTLALKYFRRPLQDLWLIKQKSRSSKSSLCLKRGTNEERVLTKEREQEIWAEVFQANDRGRVIGQGCLSRLYVKRRKRVSQVSCTPLQTQQEARIRELEERLKAQEEERKAQEEERKVQEELRAVKEAKRDEDYEMLKREVLKFGAIFKSLPEGFSSQFDSSSSALH